MFRTAVALVLLLLTLLPSAAQEKPDLQEVLPEWEAYVEKSREEWGVPSVAAAVVTPEGIVWWKGFGERALGLGPPGPDTLYSIGSTTKAFTAATLAMMVDGGGPDWDARVADQLPGFQMNDPWVTRELRVADLLAQHPGIPAQALSSMGALNYPRDRIIAALRWVEPTSSFRSRFDYVNSLHLAAGALVARWAGVPTWEDFLSQGLLKPLGMTRTSWTMQDFKAEPNRARGHARVDGELRVLEPGPFPYAFGPAGALDSTLNDMSRWMQLQLADGLFGDTRLVSQENLARTREPRTMVTPEMFYGMGWIKRFQPGYHVFWHNGGTPGHTTWVGFQPDRQVALVVLSDLGGTQMPDAAGFHFFDLLNRGEGPDYSSIFLKAHHENQARERAALTPPADARQPLPERSLEGSYRSPALGELRVGQGLLHFLDTGYSARLVPFDGSVYQLDFTDPWMQQAGWNWGGTLRFTPDRSGRIDGFDVQLGDPGQGAVLRADRR